MGDPEVTDFTNHQNCKFKESRGLKMYGVSFLLKTDAYIHWIMKTFGNDMAIDLAKTARGEIQKILPNYSLFQSLSTNEKVELDDQTYKKLLTRLPGLNFTEDLLKSCVIERVKKMDEGNKKLLEYFTSQDFDTSEGICRAVDAFEHAMSLYKGLYYNFDFFLNDCFKTWPHFSGYLSYPIVITKKEESAFYTYSKEESAFYTYSKCIDGNLNFWDHETEYGALRLNLLNHIIDCLRKDLFHDEYVKSVLKTFEE